MKAGNHEGTPRERYLQAALSSVVSWGHTMSLSSRSDTELGMQSHITQCGPLVTC